MLEGVTRGRIKMPHLFLLYGPDGIGKSTMGSEAPSPIFLGPEKGTLNLDVARFPTPKNWAQVIEAVDDLLTKSHEFKSLVIDTLDWLEPLIYSHVCEQYDTTSIEKAAGGYGKGYREAYNQALILKDKLSELRETKGMNIILLAHSKVVQFEDPTTESGYSRFELKLQDSAAVSMRSMWREYVDAVLFCNFETFVKGEGKQARGLSDRERKMWTERDAAFDAKNRFGLPFELPLSFKAYADAVDSLTLNESPEDVIKRIDKLIKKADDKTKEAVLKAIEKDSSDINRLKAIEQRLIIKLGE